MAAVFIGGAELAACYWLDPPIFHKIVDPVVEKSGDLWRFTSDQVRVAADGVKQRIAERSALRQEQIESQQAGEPAIPDGGVMIEDPAITELVIRDGQEVLTGGSVSIAYFAQSDPAWKDQPYGSDRVGPYGCGPTAMAMAVKSDRYKYRSRADGQLVQSKWILGCRKRIISQYCLWCSQCLWVGVFFSKLRYAGGSAHTAFRRPYRCRFDECRTLYQWGHFILLRGVTLDGNILVADPNSRARSLQEWDASIIINELSSSKTAGAPLWFLSKETD